MLMSVVKEENRESSNKKSENKEENAYENKSNMDTLKTLKRVINKMHAVLAFKHGNKAFHNRRIKGKIKEH